MFPAPRPTGFTIYTKSECKYCAMVKELVPDARFIDADSFLQDDVKKEEFLHFIEQLVGKPYRTFPMVFLGGEFVGGFSDTHTLLSASNDA
jgi:glutaredoxin